LRVEAIRLQRKLWLFDDYTLGIHLKGTTIEEVMKARLYRDLILIALLAVVLLIGAWVAYRNVRREVELARIKSDFVSNVSHELRTPLALIRMYIETLELGRVTSDDQRQHYYRVISQESLRLSRLINNILNFSRIEAGRKDYQMQPTDLNAVVREVLERYAFTLERQGFDVDQRPGAARLVVRGDAETITEALINLVDNAAKYSTDRKRVELTTGREGDDIFVEVADDGIGIAPEDQARIFDAFYRASDSLVHDTKGTGLGLALVYQIMEAHGGRVTVQSQPGHGSRFRLYFQPADPADVPPRALHTVAES
jgi:two-component system phosphate regulon sensor histidine kinase PhoR